MSESINSTNNSSITAATRLTQDIIEKKQQPYFRGAKYETSPKQDTVEISGKEPEQKWYQKYKKGLITAGVGALAIGAAILGHKKISADQVKKAEEEARKLEQEARQKAQEAEEKLQAQRKAEAEARRQAKLEAEAKAKADAEEKARREAENARLEAEKAQEAERLAKIAEYSKKLEAATTEFEQRCIIKPLPMDVDFVGKIERGAIFNTTMDEYGQFFVDSIKRAEEAGIKTEDLAKIYAMMHDSAVLSDEAIRSIAESYCQKYRNMPYHVKHQLMARRQFMQDLDKLKQENPQQETEKLSDYLQRLVSKRKENVEIEKQKRIETIKSRLHYDEAAGDIETVKVTQEEIEELRKALLERKSYSPAAQEKIKNGDLYTLITEYLEEATSESEAIPVPQNIQRLCLSSNKRYNSTISKGEHMDKTFRYEPLYRWIGLGKDCDEFAEETFKVGGTYSFPWQQSCSKNRYAAETYFGEDNANLNLKFVIHPKSETSRAADMGLGHYGSNEAVYAGGEKFRVIDVFDEEVADVHACIDNEFSEKSFYRKIVHLQEL